MSEAKEVDTTAILTYARQIEALKSTLRRGRIYLSPVYSIELTPDIKAKLEKEIKRLEGELIKLIK